MKNFIAMLCLSVVCTGAVRGDNMTTLTGQTYTNFSVQQYDQDGYVVLHEGGRTNVLFSEINPELRGHYKALSMIPISMHRMSRAKLAPAGPADLETVSGQIYRNVIIKKVEETRFDITHDRGLSTIYFSTLPAAMQERVRQMKVVPDVPPDADDIVTTYGVVFRNTEIILEEPDGLTFRHDGGTTKLGFPALSEEMCEKYGYDPETAWKYGRETTAKKIAAQKGPVEEKPNGPASFELYAIETQTLKDQKYWVRFSVSNITEEAISVETAPCQAEFRAVAGSKTLEIAANGVKELQQFVVPNVAPMYLRCETATYYTNTLLNWE